MKREERRWKGGALVAVSCAIIWSCGNTGVMAQPTLVPSEVPSALPTDMQTANPTSSPQAAATDEPTVMPSPIPSRMPSPSPSQSPSQPPSKTESASPSVSPTAELSPSPSAPPSKMPSPMPSDRPSLSPTSQPTSTPSNPPTLPLPTARPSASPTAMPTPTPSTSTSPSATPSQHPTKSPIVGTFPPTISSQPSPVPSPAPSPSPTHSPSASPSKAPTHTPSVMPTLMPTPFPSSMPTAMPSLSPTVTPGNPTKEPTTKSPTATPTTSPTTMPTATPTTNTSTSPSLSPVSAAIKETPMPATQQPASTPQPATPAPTSTLIGPILNEGLSITLTHSSSTSILDPEAELAFQDAYEQYILDYYNNAEARTDAQKAVDAIAVDVRVTGQTLTRRRRRKLQSNEELTITFSQSITFRSTDANVSIKDILEEPFATASKRNDFLQNHLKESSSSTNFDTVTAISDVRGAKNPTEPGGTNGDGDNDDPAISFLIIIIIVVIVVLMLAVAIYFWKCRSGSSKGYDGNGAYGGVTGGTGGISSEGEEGKPPSQLQLSGNDEVSTLAEPTPRLGVMTSNESLAGYGDQSVATVDYDYSKAYGGADRSVSSAGGTMGSLTQGGASSNAQDTTSTPAVSAVGASNSIFSDEESFEAHFNNNNNINSNQGPAVREELIDIYAPPGKLGVVIDTPDDGAPVVHAIKDSSCIADKLKVGDKLVAVDDEDVRSMTAIKVSKMISRKSANPTRKLSVIRTTVAE